MVAPEDSDINTTLIIWNKPLGFDEGTITIVDPVVVGGGRQRLGIMDEQSTITCLEFKEVKA